MYKRFTLLYHEVANNSQKGFIYVALVAGIIAVTVAGGIGYILYETAKENQDSIKEEQQAEAEKQTPQVNNPFPPRPTEGPPAPVIDMSGKWAGNYGVNGPELCNEEGGSWTAQITQTTDNKLYGSYSSASVSGNISGNVAETNGFTWTVTGGGGAQLTGSVTDQNSVAGSFTGPTCPGYSRTYGTFSGGRVGQ